MYNTTKTNEVDVPIIYDTEEFATVTTPTGFDVTAPLLLNSETGQFKVIGNGVIENTKTKQTIFKGNLNGFGIHYLDEQCYHAINKNGAVIIGKNINKQEYCIKKNISNIQLPKSLQMAKQVVCKVFNNENLLKAFSEDLRRMDEDFEKMIDESVEYDKKKMIDKSVEYDKKYFV